MDYIKEIGGFFEFSPPNRNNGNSDGLVCLNLGRSALKLAIRSQGLACLQIPAYTCAAVWQSAASVGCRLLPYDVDDDLLPTRLDKDIPILYTNYFGICSSQVKYMLANHDHVILDNAQAFYARPCGHAAIYSPRKFFPLPDGGMLWPRLDLPATIETGHSWDLCTHLLKRADVGAESAYADFLANEARLDYEPPKRMSRLTETLLASIDLEAAKQKRLENFRYLHTALADRNRLKIDLTEDDVPMVYPFWSSEAGLRKKLIANRIYVARYWPEDDKSPCMKSDKAKAMGDAILPLPIDQRYDLADMARILKVIDA